ncbi:MULTISPECIES: DUF488 domain-containing protein [Xanthomonas]|uniref:DUF488 domain-containing protein n=1 Tax=Xanthomonas TaxID=338 RepID=UPI0017C5FD2A|nr:DUF488 domain-containing protein [Xanthomonas arboricola]MBB5858489.1 uncharacterized protein (DUF488 family) [Xanthomonas arboricola]
MNIKIFTIGFTKKSAEKFFSLLRISGAVRVVDVRLNNVSQLAGFAKRDDLKFFLKEVCGMDYFHAPELAPKKEALKAYQEKKMSWAQYEAEFINLMTQRRIETSLDKKMLDKGCFLCSEDTPHQCHRRLVSEYLQKNWPDENVDVKHL